MAHEITRDETRGSGLLWFGLLGAPIAWATQVFVAPDLNEVLCAGGADGSGRGQVYGISTKTFILFMDAALLLIGLLALLATIRCYRKLRRSTDTTEGHRATWMAGAALFVNGLFIMAIAVGFIPLLFLSACGDSI
nr:hypothetical protein [Actinomycetota bacterium]